MPRPATEWPYALVGIKPDWINETEWVAKDIGVGVDATIAVNIEIMRAFVRLRLILTSNKELARRFDALEAKTDAKFAAVFEAIRQLMAPPEPKKRPIGFVTHKEK